MATTIKNGQCVVSDPDNNNKNICSPTTIGAASYYSANNFEENGYVFDGVKIDVKMNLSFVRLFEQKFIFKILFYFRLKTSTTRACPTWPHSRWNVARVKFSNTTTVSYVL